MPFDNANEKNILEKIASAEIYYDDTWKGLTEECRDFVKRLLTRNIKERMSADQALNHPWIMKNKTV